MPGYELMTTPGAAALLGISQKSVRRAADRGTLACTGRIDPLTGQWMRVFRADDVEAYKNIQRERLLSRLAKMENA